MNADVWAKLGALLDQMLELSEEERKPLLDNLRREDPSLCQEVESLLRQESLSQRLQAPPSALLKDTICLARPGGTTARLDTQGCSLPQIPGYEIVRDIARGGQSVVYQATQLSLNRPVALKMILAGAAANAEERARFRREAEAVARLKHPHIVQIYDIGEHAGEAYLALEFVGGGTLTRKLAGKTQPARAAAQLVETLARTIHWAHQLGIIHRDLKPGNVLLTEEGSPKIADFGLAKHLQADAQLTQTGHILGTPAYMAPEQAAGKTNLVGAPADVYALGAILYEMLTGRPPFVGQATWDTVEQVLHADPVPPRRLRPQTPRDLETICLKCLRKDPQARYGSAVELADDLQRFLAGHPIQARPVGALGRLLLWCRRKPALAATIAAAVLAVAVVAGAGLYQVLQERERFRGERDRAQANLYRALVGEARALMQGRDTGWWWKAMDNIRQAGTMDVADRDPAELRELAIQCMGTEYACMRLCGTWEGHTAAVTSTAFSPDGRLVASGSHDQTVRLWSVPEGKPLAVLSGPGKSVTGLAFHPEGKWLAASSADGTVRLWDASAPDSFPAAAVIDLQAGAVHALEWSPDGAALAAACQDGAIHLFAASKDKLASKSERRILVGHTGPVISLAFSETGLLASGSQDKTIRIWDVALGQQTDSFTNVNAPTTMVFGPGSDIITWGSVENYGLMSTNLVNLVTSGFAAHFNTVRQVRVCRTPYYPTLQRFLTASADGSIKLWKHGKVQEDAVARGEGSAVNALAVDASVHWVAAGCADGRVRLWELAEPTQRALVEDTRLQCACFVGSERLLFKPGSLSDFSRGLNAAPQAFGPAALTALAVHPSDQWFAFADQRGALAISKLDLRNAHSQRQEEVVRCAGHTQMIADLAVSPNGDHLASASADGAVKIWNWQTGVCGRTVEPGLGPLHKIAFGSDNRSLAITGARGVAVCDLTGERGQANVRLVRRHFLRGSSLAVFADLLAFTTPEGDVDVCELSTGRKLHTLKGHARAPFALAFSPDGKTLASSDAGAIRLWDVAQSFAEREVIHFGARFVTFDPTGRYLVAGALGPTKIWDLHGKPATPAAQMIVGHPCGQFTRAGAAFLTGRQHGSVELWTRGDIEAARKEAQGKGKWASSTFALIYALPTTLVKAGHTGEVWGVAASPDGRWLATASHDQTVKLWDVATRGLVRNLEGYSDLVWPVAFSPDSRYLATGSEDNGAGTIKVWEVATGREQWHFRGHRRQVFGLAFHPSQPWLASSSADGSIYLWDMAGGKSLGLLHQFDRAVYNVAFRPDGRWLAASCLDNRVALWELPAMPGQPVPPSRFLEGHTASVYAVAFSADGRCLASGSEQGVMILWDAQTFARVTTLKGSTGQIRSISFSRDGQLLAGGAYGSPTLVWDLSRVRRTLADMNLDW